MDTVAPLDQGLDAPVDTRGPLGACERAGRPAAQGSGQQPSGEPTPAAALSPSPWAWLSIQRPPGVITEAMVRFQMGTESHHTCVMRHDEGKSWELQLVCSGARGLRVSGVGREGAVPGAPSGHIPGAVWAHKPGCGEPLSPWDGQACGEQASRTAVPPWYIA